MKKQPMMYCVLITVWLLSVAGLPLGASHCGARQTHSNADTTKYTGIYRNEAWGFEVIIPDGFVGEDGSAGSHHGFGVSLGSTPRSTISVTGEANSLEFNRPMDAALNQVSYLQRDGNEVDSVSIGPEHLGSLDASELIVTYRKKGTAQQETMAAFIAIGPKKSPVYEVILTSPTSRYKNDRRVLDELVHSWKYTGY